jgi:L-iditol 2-dehydrogenase
VREALRMEIGTRMKAARLLENRRLEVLEEEIPVPGRGESLLQVTAVGICGSDVHWFSEGGIGDARLVKPLVLGHEFTARTSTGDRFAVDPSISCGSCEWCLGGNPNLCPLVIFAGHGEQDGALREYMTWPEKNLYRLPDTISDVEGAMLEPLGVAIHTVNLGNIRKGMTVGVFGCGPIGLLALQLAKLAGAQQIYATDILPHRLEAAIALGAAAAFQADQGREAVGILRMTDGRGVDVAIDASGDAGAVNAAFSAVVHGGRVVLAGIPDSDWTSFQASVARRKGLTIKLVRRMKNTYPLAIELVSKKRVDVKSLVTHRYPLARAVEAFEAARRRDGLKVVIEMEAKV